ncbi:MAG: hypothetical protein V4608_10945 [Bacteroidota bacterium]
MSYLSDTFIQCPTIQRMIDDMFLTCPNPPEFLPSLEAIIAGQKAAGIAQTVADGSGKVRNVQVVYTPRLKESDVTSGSGARTCTAVAERKNNYADYTIDPNVWNRADDSFTTAELATVCTEDVQSLIAKKISLIIDVLERDIATQTAAELVALAGEWGTTADGAFTVNGSNELVVAQYVSAATKAIDYSSMSTIDLALQMAGYCAPPIIVGGTAMYQYGQFVNHGCCATSGVNILDMANDYGKVIMYDKRVATALGSQLKSIAFQPGSVALITYNEAPQVPNLGANYAKFRVNSPRTGIPIDITMSDNCGVISIIGFANTKLVGLPTDAYAIGDELNGTVMINKILVTNPA